MDQEQIRVLHVDDELDFAELTETFLKQHNNRFSITTIDNAADALDLLNKNPPDCIVSDYNMPGMNGLEFLEAVRENHPRLPFILFTGKGSEAVASEAIATDVTDYIQKKGSAEQYELLANRIENAVQARRESKRADRQEHLMRLTEFAGDTGGFEIDMESREILLTDGTRRLAGLPDDANLSLDEAVEFFHPDDQADVRDTVTRAAEIDEETQATWRLQTLDGDERLLDVVIIPAENNNNGTILRGSFRDITERRARREELEQIETLFKNAQESLFLIDVAEKLTVERVNPAYEQATGLSADHLEGQTPREILGDQQGAAVEARYRECIDSREPIEYTEQLQFGVKSTQWETRIAPVVLEGSVEYIVGATRDITDRKERQRELRRLQQAIDDANAPITLADASQEDNPLVYVNDAFEEMTGYPPEETLGRNCRFLQGKNTEPEKVTALREAINNEEPISVELRNYRKDGTEFWNRLTVTPIYDDDGQLVRYLGTQEDITERKNSEEELKAEQEFTRQALNTLNDVFYVLDTDGAIQRWNEQVVEITGYNPAEIDGMALTEMFPEADQDIIASAIETIFRRGEATVEADLLTEDGERVPHEFTGARLTDKDGNVKGVVGVGRDLTERHRRERRFQALVENSDDIVSIVDADGQFQYQSPSLERILGHCPEETVGDTAWEYIHPDDRKRVREAFEEWITMPETPTSVEYRAWDAEENWRWMEARGNNQLENPAVEGCVINSREITARKEREQELDRTWDLMRNMEQLADIGGWEYDSAAESLTLTDGARRIHGIDSGTDLSLNEAFEAFHPDDRDRLTARFDECLDAGESYEIDARLTTSDGEQRWITVSGRRVNNDGSGSTVRGHIQDITEEKTRERRLTELNQAAQALLAAESRQEIADIGVEAASGVLDLEANAIHFSEADDAQLVPVAHTDKVTELAGGTTVLPVADSIAGRVYQSGEPEAVEDVREDPDTHDPETDLRSYLYLPLADHGVLIAGDKETAAFDKQDLTLGKLLAGNLVAALDRVGNKQELQDIKDQYQTLVEHFPEGAVFLYDTSLRVVRAGGSELSAVGLSPEGLRGTKPHDRYPSGIADKLVSHLNRALDGVEATFEQEYEGSRYRIRTVPVRTGDEDVGYVMAVSQNITEQAEQRQRLKRQNEQLEEFTSIVSHDLQSPLSVARGQLELAEEPTGGEHLEKASAAIERGQALIDDLLTLAHEGQRVAETDAVALVDVAKDSWQTVETAQATLDVGGSAIIEADRSRLKQLLENLYRNAIEHGGEEITVHVTPIEGGFQVSDTGCGIPEAERGEIFEAGYSTSADGTGFGLRIVEEIAEAHGWEIAVSEGEQGGARFEFTQVEFVQE